MKKDHPQPAPLGLREGRSLHWWNAILGYYIPVGQARHLGHEVDGHGTAENLGGRRLELWLLANVAVPS